MAVQMTSSVKWRQMGNEIYSSATNLAPVLRKERLQQAINLYLKAFEAQTNTDELTSAAKNLGMASWRLGDVLEEKYSRIYHYKESAKYFSIAYEKGLSVKCQSWLETLIMSTTQFLEEVFMCLQSFSNPKERTKYLYDIANAISVRNLKAQCFLALADVIFKAGVTALSEGQPKQCLDMMRECYRPIEEVKRFGHDDASMMSEARVYEEDVFVHQCIAESIQARLIGDDLFNRMLKEEDSLNMDVVWDVVDWYKQSILLTREKDLELEAIGHTCLARVYDQVLKLKFKAKENFLHCLQLVNTMHPRVFTNEKWYQYATQTLSQYQQEVLRQEEDAWSTEKSAILIELQDDIKKLEELSENAEGFLRFVYKTYPPKNVAHKLNESLLIGENKNVKKALRDGLLHYHPDRLKAKDLGKKWIVLCEEITKYLNRKYEVYK